jgi:hypothetical protein
MFYMKIWWEDFLTIQGSSKKFKGFNIVAVIEACCRRQMDSVQWSYSKLSVMWHVWGM